MPKNPRERFQDMLESFTSGMLITQGAPNGMVGRPMNVAKVESDADLWFCTSIESDKVGDILRDPNVAIVFQDSGRYLTVNGSATLSTDQSKLDDLWNETWRVWFPQGKDDPNLALIHVDASHGQYWDNSWLQGLTYAIRAGRAYWQGDTPDVPAEINSKVSLG